MKRDKEILWEMQVVEELADLLEADTSTVQAMMEAHPDAEEKMSYCYDCGATAAEAANDVLEYLN